jgi:hypothetical protein
VVAEETLHAADEVVGLRAVSAGLAECQLELRRGAGLRGFGAQLRWL